MIPSLLRQVLCYENMLLCDGNIMKYCMESSTNPWYVYVYFCYIYIYIHICSRIVLTTMEGIIPAKFTAFAMLGGIVSWRAWGAGLSHPHTR